MKWAWEVGRSRHLVELARGVYSDPENPRLLSCLEQHLQSWIEHNPPEIGIHWYSNLEIALRSLVWLQVIGLCEHRLSPRLVDGVSDHIVHAGRHLLADLPYTLSTMRTNHLLGDSLGLLAIGKAKGRGGWAMKQAAERLARLHARGAFEADGSMVEDSLSYHRFVLEMLIVRRLLGVGSHSEEGTIIASAQFLARLGVLDGPVPQYGDWDEGRVLVSSNPPGDVSGTVRLALSLSGTGSPPEWHDAHDECSWYAPIGQPVEPEEAERDGHPVGGGFARAARGPFIAWLKAGGNVSHQHADLCSTPILCDGEWAVGDPGTGTYNGPLEQRNYFRCSIAHNVLRMHDEDQLGPHRAFRWRHRAHGVSGEPVRFDDTIVMPGAHDAYARLLSGGRIARAVVVQPSLVLVVDWAEVPRPVPYALSLPFGPKASWDADAGIIRLASGRGLYLTACSVPGVVDASTEPFDGWWSDTYGALAPASRLELRGSLDRPVWWALSTDSGIEAEIDDDWIALNDLRMRVSFTTTGVLLTTRTKSGERTTRMTINA